MFDRKLPSNTSLYLNRIEGPPPKVLLYLPRNRGKPLKREKNADFATLCQRFRRFGTLFGTLWCLFRKM